MPNKGCVSDPISAYAIAPSAMSAFDKLKGTASTAKIIAIEALRISIAMWPNETALSRLVSIRSVLAELSVRVLRARGVIQDCPPILAAETPRIQAGRGIRLSKFAGAPAK